VSAYELLSLTDAFRRELDAEAAAVDVESNGLALDRTACFSTGGDQLSN
jgi:Ser-tRNA(Ala) deacylase AlaX